MIEHKIHSFTASHSCLLLDFLLSSMPEQSKTKTKELLQRRQVLVNTRVCTRFNYELEPGDVVDIVRAERNPYDDCPFRVLYEDRWLLAIEKPSGVLSVGNPTTSEPNAFSMLKAYCRSQSKATALYVCHRLDQYTSGILVFAKDARVQETLRDAWNDYVSDRRYIAVTEGTPKPQSGEIRSFLVENSAMRVYSARNAREGKLAITRYKVLAEKAPYALIDVQILTGRKNQIRVHLSEHGWAIAGDRKYGAKTNPVGRLMLHNSRLAMCHPVTDEELCFEIPVPRSFMALFDKA